MRTLMYTFIFTVLTTSFVSCSKESLVDDEILIETVATEGDDEEEKKRPGEE